MNLMNNSIVFDKNVVNLISYLHIYMHWEEIYRHIFLQTYFLQIYKLNLYQVSAMKQQVESKSL